MPSLPIKYLINMDFGHCLRQTLSLSSFFIRYQSLGLIAACSIASTWIYLTDPWFKKVRSIIYGINYKLLVVPKFSNRFRQTNKQTTTEISSSFFFMWCDSSRCWSKNAIQKEGKNWIVLILFWNSIEVFSDENQYVSMSKKLWHES